jgi:hypothetical protein
MKRAPNQPERTMALYGGVYALLWSVPDAGTICPAHAHTYDHMTLLQHGAVHVLADGVDLGVFRAPAFIKIPARTRHTFTTLETDTAFCCLHAVGAAESVDDDDLIHERHDLLTEET